MYQKHYHFTISLGRLLPSLLLPNKLDAVDRTEILWMSPWITQDPMYSQKWNCAATFPISTFNSGNIYFEFSVQCKDTAVSLQCVDPPNKKWRRQSPFGCCWIIFLAPPPTKPFAGWAKKLPNQSERRKLRERQPLSLCQLPARGAQAWAISNDNIKNVSFYCSVNWTKRAAQKKAVKSADFSSTITWIS